MFLLVLLFQQNITFSRDERDIPPEMSPNKLLEDSEIHIDIHNGLRVWV